MLELEGFQRLFRLNFLWLVDYSIDFRVQDFLQNFDYSLVQWFRVRFGLIFGFVIWGDVIWVSCYYFGILYFLFEVIVGVM